MTPEEKAMEYLEKIDYKLCEQCKHNDENGQYCNAYCDKEVSKAIDIALQSKEEEHKKKMLKEVKDLCVVLHNKYKNDVKKALQSRTEEICEFIMRKPKCMCASVTHAERTNSIKRKIVEDIKQEYLKRQDK